MGDQIEFYIWWIFKDFAFKIENSPPLASWGKREIERKNAADQPAKSSNVVIQIQVRTIQTKWKKRELTSMRIFVIAMHCATFCCVCVGLRARVSTCFSIWFCCFCFCFRIFISLRKAYRHAHYNTHFLMHKLFGGHWYGCGIKYLDDFACPFSLSLSLCVYSFLFICCVLLTLQKLTHKKWTIYAWIALIILIMDLKLAAKMK